jgi:hypothetical protein
MTHALTTEELNGLSGGRAQDYLYLEEQFGTLVGLAFLGGALGSGLALGGAIAVGGLMLMDDLFTHYW